MAFSDHIVISHFSLNKCSIPQTFSVLKASNVFAERTMFSLPSARQSLWHTVQIFSSQDTTTQWFGEKAARETVLVRKPPAVCTPTPDKAELETKLQQ